MLRTSILFSTLFCGSLLINTMHAAPVILQNASATFHQGNFGNVDQTIDGNSAGNNGMGFYNARFSATNIAWETQSNVSGPGLLTFTIDSNLGAAHSLRSFRLATTDAHRSLFADGNPPNGIESPPGDILPSPGHFTLLQPLTATSANGATLAIGKNGVINVSGSIPAIDTYTITARNPVSSGTGFRLEALSGSNGAVGFAGNGNATISEFGVDFVAGGKAVNFPTKQVNLTNATATFDQGGPFTIGSAIDGVFMGNNGWGVFGQQNNNQVAVFQTETPLDATSLVFDLDQTSGFVNHKLQDFRISYTTDANPTAGDLGIAWHELTPTDVETSLAASNATIDALNNVVSVSGSGAVSDIYQVFVDGVDLSDVTGFRLEALTLTDGVVGFAGNGNIVLSEFQVFATNVPEPTSITLWTLLGLCVAGYGIRRNASRKM